LLKKAEAFLLKESKKGTKNSTAPETRIAHMQTFWARAVTVDCRKNKARGISL